MINKSTLVPISTECCINSELYFLFSRNNRDIADIKWIKQNIVDKYEFKKNPNKDEWETQPTFQGVLTDNHFIDAADRVKKFFVRNNDWETTKNNPKFRTHDGCIGLLYITAARYLLVTRILHAQSLRKLIPCEEKVGKKTLIPLSGVCYPAPPSGSATCTSDYDVSLVGKDAGFLIEKFNNYFQDVFKKPSDLVFDTNVYAFTTAYAFPVNYEGLPPNFPKDVEERKKTVNFKMQELASAYFKVFKYNPGFFDTMKKGALGAMKVPESKTKLNKWLRVFSKLNGVVKMRIEEFNNSPVKLRKAHNAEYQKRVKEMSQKGGYNAELLGSGLQRVLRDRPYPNYFSGGDRGLGDGYPRKLKIDVCRKGFQNLTPLENRKSMSLLRPNYKTITPY